MLENFVDFVESVTDRPTKMMLFLENIHVFNQRTQKQQTDRQSDRQTGLLWQ